MPKQTKPLTVASFNALPAGTHYVGGATGLAVRIAENGNRTWIQKIAIADETENGNRRMLTLGHFPAISLAGARAIAASNIEKGERGIDPTTEGEYYQRLNRSRAASRNTAPEGDKLDPKAAMLVREVTEAAEAAEKRKALFRDVVERYFETDKMRKLGFKSQQQWRQTIRDYANPVIGHIAVSQINSDHILMAVEPLWSTKPATAIRLRGRLEKIFGWAARRGYRSGDNPAVWRNNLEHDLSSPNAATAKHHASLAWTDTPEFMAKLTGIKGPAARCLEFAILTATRSGEARGMRWDEINFEKRIWTIPASRMKARREHVVPLSDRALGLLRSQPHRDGSDLVFTAPRLGELTGRSLLLVVKRIGAKATPHGFRSSFRDWISEATEYSYEVAELSLAHAVGSVTERSYFRSDLLEQRGQLMQDWAAYITTGEAESIAA